MTKSDWGALFLFVAFLLLVGGIALIVIKVAYVELFHTYISWFVAGLVILGIAVSVIGVWDLLDRVFGRQ